MCDFDSIAQVDAELERLSGLPEPMVARLARRPGQKEERWVQLLTDASAPIPASVMDVAPVAGSTEDLATEVAGLRCDVAELRAAVAELREQLEAVHRDFYD